MFLAIGHVVFVRKGTTFQIKINQFYPIATMIIATTTAAAVVVGVAGARLVAPARQSGPPRPSTASSRSGTMRVWRRPSAAAAIDGQLVFTLVVIVTSSTASSRNLAALQPPALLKYTGPDWLKLDCVATLR